MQVQNLNRENPDKTFRPYNVSYPTTIARHKSRGSKPTSDQDNNWWTYIYIIVWKTLGQRSVNFSPRGNRLYLRQICQKLTALLILDHRETATSQTKQATLATLPVLPLPLLLA